MSLEKHYTAMADALSDYRSWRDGDLGDPVHPDDLRDAGSALLSSLADDPPEEMVLAAVAARMASGQNDQVNRMRDTLSAALREAAEHRPS